MKNPYTLFICSLLFISCNLGQKPIDVAEIQKMFNVTKGVKEIRTASKIFTTLGERSFSSKTIFKEKTEHRLKPLLTAKMEKLKKQNLGLALMKKNLTVRKLKRSLIKIKD
jgi:hypothetical protein